MWGAVHLATKEQQMIFVGSGFNEFEHKAQISRGI